MRDGEHRERIQGEKRINNVDIIILYFPSFITVNIFTTDFLARTYEATLFLYGFVVVCALFFLMGHCTDAAKLTICKSVNGRFWRNSSVTVSNPGNIVLRSIDALPIFE